MRKEYFYGTIYYYMSRTIANSINVIVVTKEFEVTIVYLKWEYFVDWDECDDNDLQYAYDINQNILFPIIAKKNLNVKFNME